MNEILTQEKSIYLQIAERARAEYERTGEAICDQPGDSGKRCKYIGG